MFLIPLNGKKGRPKKFRSSYINEKEVIGNFKSLFSHEKMEISGNVLTGFTWFMNYHLKIISSLHPKTPKEELYLPQHSTYKFILFHVPSYRNITKGI